MKSACYLRHVRPPIRTCRTALNLDGFPLNSILGTFMKICRLVDKPKQVREEYLRRVKYQGLLGLLFNNIRQAVSLCSPFLVCTEAANGTRMYSKNFWIELKKLTSFSYGLVPHYTTCALVKFRVASGLAYNQLHGAVSLLKGLDSQKIPSFMESMFARSHHLPVSWSRSIHFTSPSY